MTIKASKKTAKKKAISKTESHTRRLTDRDKKAFQQNILFPLLIGIGQGLGMRLLNYQLTKVGSGPLKKAEFDELTKPMGTDAKKPAKKGRKRRVLKD